MNFYFTTMHGPRGRLARGHNTIALVYFPQRLMERDRSWYQTRVHRLDVTLSAWFACECSSRVLAFAVEEESLRTLHEVQQFLLGRLSWHELERARKAAQGQVWATSRNRLLSRLAKRAIYAATFPESAAHHAAAAEYARRLDDRSIKPLTDGVREASLQQQRLEVFSTYAASMEIQRLAQAYRKTRQLELLGLISDALQDAGFQPPLFGSPG